MKDIFNPYKLLNHCDCIQHMVTDNKTYPVAVEIDLTNKCNHRCVWCMFDKFKEKTPVTLEKQLVFNLLNELQEVGVKAITYVGGGEPTLHKDFDEIITRSYEMGFEVGLVTNGEIIDTKVDLLKKCCKFVRVSLDAGSRKTHDILHKPKSNDFKKTSAITSFGRIIKGLKKLCKDKGELVVGCGFLVHPDNFFEIPDLVNLLFMANVDYLQIRPVYMKGLTFSDKMLNELDKMMEKALDIAKGTNLHIVANWKRFKEFNGQEEKVAKCLAHNILSIICADGKLYLCCQLRGNKRFELGDLHDQSFREIWEGEKRQVAINNVNMDRCPPCRYSTYNKIMDYMASERRHGNFL